MTRLKAERKFTGINGGIVNINYVERQEELLTVEEASKVCKCNVNTIYALIKEKKIIAMQLPSYRIRVKELDRFIRDNQGEDLGDIVRAYTTK